MITPSDDELLAALSQALAATDPVPDRVREAANAAWTWRTIDAELAELTFDSAVMATGSRGEVIDRQLTFRAGDVEIELMVTDDRMGSIAGQLVADAPARAMRLEWAGRQQSVAIDELGRFQVRTVPSGPLRLALVLDDGRVVTSDWVTIVAGA